jgi:hypothetical protein
MGDSCVRVADSSANSSEIPTMSLVHSILLRAFGRPQGVMGKLGGFIMARTNHKCAVWVIGLLDIKPNDKVLEVGFGPGLGIQFADGYVDALPLCERRCAPSPRHVARDRDFLVTMHVARTVDEKIADRHPHDHLRTGIVLDQRIVLAHRSGTVQAQPIRLLEIEEQHADLGRCPDVAQRVKHAIAVVARERDRALAQNRDRSDLRSLSSRRDHAARWPISAEALCRPDPGARNQGSDALERP